MEEKNTTVENREETMETSKGADELVADATADTDVTASIQPEGECIYSFDVLIKVGDLYDYLLKHGYSRFDNLFISIMGAALIVLFATGHASALYLIFGIIVVLYLPVNYYFIAKRQAMQGNFKEPWHYEFYENGMRVSQGEASQMHPWENMIKAISTSKSIILYTGRNAASVFPRRCFDGDATALIRVISTHLPPNKVKIKE